MSKYLTWLAICVLLSISLDVFAEEVPFTLEDRDRLIRVEVKLEDVDKRFEQIDKRFEQIDKRFEQIDKRFEQIDKRFIELREDMNKRFDQLINIFIGIVAAFAGIVAVTIGFAIWDRRTALRPVLERSERWERAVREYAKQEPRLAEVLKSLGLM
jgi:predicted nuclease with TOPRIM domain